MIPLKRTSHYILFLFILCLTILFLFSSCKQYHRNASHANVPVSSIRNGEILAAQYCQSCHALPDPAWLNAASWEKGVLPQMGPRLGVFQSGFESYPSYKYDSNLPANFYPAHPLLSPTEWQDLFNYYVATAPDTLISASDSSQVIDKSMSPFSVAIPAISHANPATTLVKIMPAAKGTSIWVSDAIQQKLFQFNSQLQVTDSVVTKGPVVDVAVTGTTAVVCNVGILNPSNKKEGYTQAMQMGNNSVWKMASDTLFSHLARPVQVVPADINQDGRQDYIVCEFGFIIGALSWMENKGNGQFERHILRQLPGAIKAEVQDYNGDGKPDIWVLFAQGEEGIFLYTNKGGGRFDEKEVLRFPPVNGSSSFQLADFNKDGFADIIYTCGDNADYSPVLKPYHGMYIYLNDGKNHFTQQYFYHINGCYKAIARDFDGDGDVDIATIAYFADYKNKPEEGFIYFENKGHFQFRLFTDIQLETGRWLTMDAGDVNGDGKPDLVLGNFSIGPAMMPSTHNWKKGPPFIVLLNKGTK